MMTYFLALKAFLPTLRGHHVPGPLGQHDCGSLYKSPMQCQVTLPLQDGKMPPLMVTVQLTLTEGGFTCQAD